MTPGTYLRKRREAAGITIGQTAAFLANLPIATANFEAASTLLRSALVLIEADRASLTPAQARIVKAAFPFDTGVYAALVSGNRPAPRICRGCACSTFDPCNTPDGPCAWSDLDYCTACDERVPTGHPQTTNSDFFPQPMEAAHG